MGRQLIPRGQLQLYIVISILASSLLSSILKLELIHVCFVSSNQVVCLGALSCAMVAVGSCHGDLTESFLQIMMEREASDLGKTHIRYLALALALLYLCLLYTSPSPRDATLSRMPSSA